MGKLDRFLRLEQELDIYRKVMTQASQIMHDQEVTKYPIFAAHQQELELGLVLSERDAASGLLWSIHASSLEEFVSKQIIHEDKIEEFKTNYKDPKNHLCVFVLSELGAQFVFLPIAVEL